MYCRASWPYQARSGQGEGLSGLSEVIVCGNLTSLAPHTGRDQEVHPVRRHAAAPGSPADCALVKGVFQHRRGQATGGFRHALLELLTRVPDLTRLVTKNAAAVGRLRHLCEPHRPRLVWRAHSATKGTVEGCAAAAAGAQGWAPRVPREESRRE